MNSRRLLLTTNHGWWKGRKTALTPALSSGGRENHAQRLARTTSWMVRVVNARIFRAILTLTLWLITLAAPAQPQSAAPASLAAGADDRAFAVQTLTRVARPVLAALAEGRLKVEMPAHSWERTRTNYAPLEAFGRTLAGIAPWLELGPDATAEGRERAEFIELSRRSLINATDPRSPDFMNFRTGGQPLVDAAFLALGLLRAPDQLWEPLTPEQRSNVVAALKSTRIQKPGESNWLLFSATIEAALWHFTGDFDLKPIDYAVKRHEEWYLGDGIYGDGPEFHWDYYNSYVIQPMLLEVLRVCAEKKHPLGRLYPQALARAQRYAVEEERLISPEGTFPVMGRSSAYRFGAFHLLSDMALLHALPPDLDPAAVRSGLTAVTRRMIEAPDTFDTNGWLQVGAVGHQPSIRESYISTGSLYLCLFGLVDLGLPATDPFWSAPGQAWSQRRIWSGADVSADHAYRDKDISK
jgi:hypothetical protein